MDGGSTDGTVDILKRYDKQISYWQSCKDRGQSDAINQGVRKAKGEFVTWLNSDDVLMPGALETVSKTICRYPTYDFFLGNVLWIDKSGMVIRAAKVESESLFWNKHHIFSNGGPSAFMRRKIFLDLGGVREDFDYMMDTELWHRFVAGGHPFKRINEYVWGLRLHENAKMSGQNFADSPFADKSHPSHQQKIKENDIITSHYPHNRFLISTWRLLKIFDIPLVFSRFKGLKLRGKHYSEITTYD